MLYYKLADRLGKSVAEIMQLSEAELQGWSEYISNVKA